MGRSDAAREFTLPGFLAEIESRHRRRTAWRFGDQQWTYAALARDASRLARGLVAAGVGPGAHVGVLIANRPEWAIACFGAARAGAVVVPISSFATPEERDHLLSHGRVEWLLMQREIAGRDLLAELRERHRELERSVPGRTKLSSLPSLRGVTCLGAGCGEAGVEPLERRVAHGHAVPETHLRALAETIRPQDPGMLVYTSGSTERPKGVLHAQRAPVIQAWRFAELMALEPDDVVWSAQPFFWTAGIAQSLGATLAAGASLVTEEVFEPGSALALIERSRASVVHAWPHQEKAMAEHPSAIERDLSCIRRVEFRSPLARLAGIDEDRWGIHASYGLSETFTLCTALPASAPAPERRACHGRPLPGMELRIAHPETGKPQPPDQPGEILVRGNTLMLGYWQVARELTLDSEGFFHTGDGGSLDADGRLHWTGRLSNAIKTGGANVSPLEVESAAAGFPGVAATAAVGVAHPTLGEVVVLCVIPTESVEPDWGALETRLRERLSAYKRPRRIVRIEPDDAPTTDTQKLRASALREIALERLAAERAEIEGHLFGG